MLRNLTAADFTKMPFHQDHNYHSLPSTHALNTPSDSCNISPSESCRVSCELNPDDHDFFFRWSTELNNNDNNNYLSRKKVLPWPKRLKLGNKLKSSRAYLKSLFTKASAKGNCSSGRNYEEIANEYKKNPNTIAAIIMKGVDCKDGIEDDNNNHRRSFSSAIKRRYPVKCLSSSSSSSSSNRSNGFPELRRSSSATEIEGSIQAAIAHCKKSCEIAEQKRSGFCSI
ncbi:probable membrane-associated kinase regulator 4 [Phtheirospermum japonicum]|uniref:Probable membrane-associated kinase regulator 4 n=1 Tax=Phtheirospermum japonicum TaxID=374723 RepID=A0A830B9E3_9LAMI|nr:probable membrane-associated kinase regulator 4 [Phtheirospermum japonicum]